MKKRIAERIALARATPPQEAVYTSDVFSEEAELDRRIEAIMRQLPNNTPWFTPKQIANVIGRCDAWVRNRFRSNPHCFDTGNGAKVYLAIPRDVLETELRSMYRCRIGIAVEKVEPPAANDWKNVIFLDGSLIASLLSMESILLSWPIPEK